MTDATQTTTPPPTPPVAPPETSGGDGTSRLLAALGYIFGIVALVALIVDPYKEQKFSRFHAVQALGLWVVGAALGFLAVIPLLGWVLAPIGYLVLFVVAIIGAVRAYRGGWWKVPLVHNAVKGFIDG